MTIDQNKLKPTLKDVKKPIPNWIMRLLVTLILMIGLFTLAAVITYLGNYIESKEIKSYQDCINDTKSTIQETYPAICVTKDGQKYIQPLSEEEQRLLEAPIDQNENQDAEGKFCGGIAANLPINQCPEGYWCKLDGNYPDAGGVCQKN